MQGLVPSLAMATPLHTLFLPNTLFGDNVFTKHALYSYQSLQFKRCSVLFIAPMLLSSCRLSRLQVTSRWDLQPGCIELVPGEKLASHVSKDYQVAAAGRRLAYRYQLTSWRWVVHPAQLMELGVFHCTVNVVLFVFCSPHLIGPSEPEGLSDDGTGVLERWYRGVLCITASPWSLSWANFLPILWLWQNCGFSGSVSYIYTCPYMACMHAGKFC